MVFVPLGAGTEHMGSMVLTRRDAQREWTAIECSALLDIGHDLGRATLNARTFGREHALVAELQALDTYKSQLIATVSHELKSPLTAVAGHLEMLESGMFSTGEQAKPSLAAIGRACKRMALVIDDLLLLRKVGDPAKPLGQESVDLVVLVKDAVALTALAAQTKHLAVTVDRAGPSRADPRGARGARQGRDERGQQRGQVHPRGAQRPHHRRAGPGRGGPPVVDRGLGISAEDRAKLFTEFFRSTNPEAFSLPGTGLGLAIVKRIVERHDGTVEVESTLGQGSTFTVTLPAA